MESKFYIRRQERTNGVVERQILVSSTYEFADKRYRLLPGSDVRHAVDARVQHVGGAARAKQQPETSSTSNTDGGVGLIDLNLVNYIFSCKQN